VGLGGKRGRAEKYCARLKGPGSSSMPNLHIGKTVSAGSRAHGNKEKVIAVGKESSSSPYLRAGWMGGGIKNGTAAF